MLVRTIRPQYKELSPRYKLIDYFYATWDLEALIRLTESPCVRTVEGLNLMQVSQPPPIYQVRQQTTT